MGPVRVAVSSCRSSNAQTVAGVADCPQISALTAHRSHCTALYTLVEARLGRLRLAESVGDTKYTGSWVGQRRRRRSRGTGGSGAACLQPPAGWHHPRAAQMRRQSRHAGTERAIVPVFCGQRPIVVDSDGDCAWLVDPDAPLTHIARSQWMRWRRVPPDSDTDEATD